MVNHMPLQCKLHPNSMKLLSLNHIYSLCAAFVNVKMRKRHSLLVVDHMDAAISTTELCLCCIYLYNLDA